MCLHRSATDGRDELDGKQLHEWERYESERRVSRFALNENVMSSEKLFSFAWYGDETFSRDDGREKIPCSRGGWSWWKLSSRQLIILLSRHFPSLLFNFLEAKTLCNVLKDGSENQKKRKIKVLESSKRLKRNEEKMALATNCLMFRKL